jgi:AraC family transcriptional regulator
MGMGGELHRCVVRDGQEPDGDLFAFASDRGTVRYKRRLDELSAVAGRHPAHLSSEFRRFFGKTISQFIRERRVPRAAELLRSASGNVCDVAIMCGFYDQSHFTHAFRRMMGYTPAQYRSMLRLA